MNVQLVEFRSKLRKQDRHWMCLRHWEGLGFIALCNCACHEKKEDASYPTDIGASIIHKSDHKLGGVQINDRP